MIRLAKILEIPDILHITKACTQNMCRQGIFQWNEFYPSRKEFETDVSRGELYVFEKDKMIIGTVVITSHMDAEYEKVEWLTPHGDNRYIHRLSVHPNFQGKGFARELMDYAESRAREQGAISIRLDTFSKNFRNQQFYEKRGYQRLGNVYFPNQSDHPFYCYELIL